MTSRVVADLRRRLARNKFDPKVDDPSVLTDKRGVYLVCLRDGASPPPHCNDVVFTHFRGLRVLYLGISASQNQGLRGRDYHQHFEGHNAGRSTLRKSLGVLFDYGQIPRDKDNPCNGKTKFSRRREEELSQWMKESLVLYFAKHERPQNLRTELRAVEAELIERLNPPLNLAMNNNAVNEEFRRNLSCVRKRYRTWRQLGVR